MNHARRCTKRIVKVLKEKLTEEELDLLFASICYDTGQLTTQLEIPGTTKHSTKCEKEFSGKDK